MKSTNLLSLFAFMIVASFVFASADQADAGCGLFSKMRGGCCEPAPVCCEPAPTCDPCCKPRCGLFARLKAKFGNKCCDPCEPVCCEPEPVCCEPEPCAAPCEPAPCAEPCVEAAPCCEAEPTCCEPEPCCEKKCGIFSRLKGKFGNKCCEAAPACGC